MLYSSPKYDAPRIFYHPSYYYLPRWANPDTLTFLQAVKIINYRMKNANYDNFKPENIDVLIDKTKTQQNK